MRRVWIVATTVAALAGLAIGATVVWPIGFEPDRIGLTGDAQRGAYLARASGCIACHTDDENNGAPLAGGAPLKTPFGTFFPPNLTTDADHGIGGWTQEQFAKAVRQGISPNGLPYYPSFTYPFYANFTDQQVADLWAAFQTVPPVPRSAPEHDTPFPFNQRWGLKLWRAAFLRAPETGLVPGNGALWNRGRELVGGATHCGACHTGRNLFGARKSDTGYLQGNTDLPGGGRAPPIDHETLKRRGWDMASLAYALRTGVTPSGDVFGSSMGKVVMQGTRFLTRDDLTAIATYVMDDREGS